MAIAIETLIAWGHSPRDVWGYTLRQMDAFMQLGQARRNIEMSQDLALHSLAARGKQEDLTKTHKELTRGAHL
jgi:hypothetical protein